MDRLETALMQTDFSKYTDLKTRLRSKLFDSCASDKVVSFPFRRLPDEEAEMVNAAQGIPVHTPASKKDPLV